MLTAHVVYDSPRQTRWAFGQADCDPNEQHQDNGQNLERYPEIAGWSDKRGNRPAMLGGEGESLPAIDVH
jgi:hypothetical protein